MRRLTVLLLSALLLAACGGTAKQHASGSSSGPAAAVTSLPVARGSSSASPALAPPGAGGHLHKSHIKSKVTSVLNDGKVRVCSLLTAAQVNHAMGVKLPASRPVPVGTFAECLTKTRAGRVVAWAVPPAAHAAANFRQHTISLPAADAVPGLGDKAFCTSSDSAGAQLFALSHGRFVEAFADSCGHASALARLVLERV
jgi:hypothetical protein